MGFSKVKILSALFFLISGLFLFGQSANAQSLNNFSFDLSFQSNLNDLSNLDPTKSVIPPGLHVKPTMSVMLCDIRRMFCGNLGLALVATTVFITGIMILSQKMSWPSAVLTVVLVTIFVNAGEIAALILESGVFGGAFNFINTKTCFCT